MWLQGRNTSLEMSVEFHISTAPWRRVARTPRQAGGRRSRKFQVLQPVLAYNPGCERLPSGTCCTGQGEIDRKRPDRNPAAFGSEMALGRAAVDDRPWPGLVDGGPRKLALNRYRKEDEHVRNAALGFLALIMGVVGFSSTTAGVHSPSGLAQTAVVRSPGIGPHRWVYASRSLQEQKHVSELIEIARQASAGGMNGMVLSGGYGRTALKDPAYLGRLKQVTGRSLPSGCRVDSDLHDRRLRRRP